MRLPLIAGALLLAFTLARAPAPAAPATTGVMQTTLVDQDGRAFTLASLRGRPIVVTFVAAHCADACPLINAQFARAQTLLRERHVDARLLTITLDPEHDSFADMRGIARTFSAERSRWIVASGNVSRVHALMRAFGVTAERGARGYADVHSTYIYLLDRHARLYATKLASTDLADQILAEVASAWRALTA